MVEGYGKRLRSILKENGWRLLRHGKGDHEFWISDATGRRVSWIAELDHGEPPYAS